jgi:hypothetical protein
MNYLEHEDPPLVSGLGIEKLPYIYNYLSHLRRLEMPDKKHLKGVGEKEQRQYEHIKKDAQQSGRYGGRAEEVAARTVMKQHGEKGHKKGQ